MMRSLLIVGVGSCFGGMLRFLVSALLKPQPGQFPLGTLAANLTGCLLIGLFYGLSARYARLSGDVLLLLTTGLCGGFTTFSTFANESLAMLEAHHYLLFAAYVAVSLVAGLLLVLLGSHLARML